MIQNKFIEKNSEIMNEQVQHILKTALHNVLGVEVQPPQISLGSRNKITLSASLKKEIDALISEMKLQVS